MVLSEWLSLAVGSQGGSWVVSVESVWFSQEKLKTLAQRVFIWYIFSPTYNLRIFQSILSPLVVSKAQYFPNWRLTISNLMGYDSIQSRAKQNLSTPIRNWVEKRPGKVPFIKEWNCALCGGVAITCGFNCRKNRKKPWNNHCIGSAKKFILVFPWNVTRNTNALFGQCNIWTWVHVNLSFWVSHLLAMSPCLLWADVSWKMEALADLRRKFCRFKGANVSGAWQRVCPK